MNILMIALSLEAGGITRYMLELSAILGKKGHKVFLISLRQSENDMAIASENVLLIHLNRNLHGFANLFRGYLAVNKLIANMTRSERIDLIVNNTPLSSMLSIILIRAFRMKVDTIRVVHGMWGTELRQYPDSASIYGSTFFEKVVRNLGVVIEKIELRRSDRIIAVNDEIKSYVERMKVRKKVHVIPAGVDTEKFSPMHGNKAELRNKLGLVNKPVVLFVGALREVKGVRLFIESASDILQNHNVQFILVGGGTDFGNYQSMIKEKSIDDNVKMVGNKNDSTLPQYYKASDIFCLPSLHEGLPQTLLEAMSSGLPSIATAVGGIPSLVNDGVNGVLIESNNVEILEAKVKLLIANPEIARRMGREARRTITDSYSWDIICDRFLHVLTGDSDRSHEHSDNGV